MIERFFTDFLHFIKRNGILTAFESIQIDAVLLLKMGEIGDKKDRGCLICINYSVIPNSFRDLFTLCGVDAETSSA